jgi:hypothetical protein
MSEAPEPNPESADSPPAQASSDEAPPEPASVLVHAHLRVGWIALLAFVTLGIALESLHAFKSAAYLGVGQETRRLMWTLAHAHGVGLSLVHIAYAATLHAWFTHASRSLRLASRLLTWATGLVPGGFFLGGVVTYGGDPGVGAFLVPVGAGLMWIAVALVAHQIWTTRSHVPPA